MLREHAEPEASVALVLSITPAQVHRQVRGAQGLVGRGHGYDVQLGGPHPASCAKSEAVWPTCREGARALEARRHQDHFSLFVALSALRLQAPP